MEVEISREYNQTVIRVANLTLIKEERLTEMFDAGFSTKTNHEGLGLFSVNQIVERYNGVLLPELKGNMFIMNVRLPQSK